MPTSKISVTLYTLRDFVKTPAEISETLKRVKSIGYKNIQLSALGVINPRDLAEMIHDNKLNVCATHVPFERLTTELYNVIA